MCYRKDRISGGRVRVTDLRGKPVAMYDPHINKEFRWENNQWHEAPLMAKDVKTFVRRYGFMFVY